MQLFNNTCKMVGITTNKAVIDMFISPDRKWCMLEFRAISDADTAINSLNGLKIGDRNIRVNRPQNYYPTPKWLRKYFVGKRPRFIPECVNLDRWNFGFLNSVIDNNQWALPIDFETGDVYHSDNHRKQTSGNFEERNDMTSKYR
eukprot:UN33156